MSTKKPASKKARALQKVLGTDPVVCSTHVQPTEEGLLPDNACTPPRPRANSLKLVT